MTRRWAATCAGAALTAAGIGAGAAGLAWQVPFALFAGALVVGLAARFAEPRGARLRARWKPSGEPLLPAWRRKGRDREAGR